MIFYSPEFDELILCCGYYFDGETGNWLWAYGNYPLSNAYGLIDWILVGRL